MPERSPVKETAWLLTMKIEFRRGAKAVALQLREDGDLEFFFQGSRAPVIALLPGQAAKLRDLLCQWLGMPELLVTKCVRCDAKIERYFHPIRFCKECHDG